MNTTLYGNLLDVRLTPGEKFATESAWWYALKEHLNNMGHDLVKKIMAKDGHMMGGDDGPYYLRDRQGRYCFADDNYAIRPVHKEDKVTLTVYRF